MSAPFLLVPKGGFMMTVSARSLLCIPSAPTSHLTKSTCMQRDRQSSSVSAWDTCRCLLPSLAFAEGPARVQETRPLTLVQQCAEDIRGGQCA